MKTHGDWFSAGFDVTVPVIPPGAPLSPRSKIRPDDRGKVPGILLHDGTWCGFRWRNSAASARDRQDWDLAGASVGLAAARYPAVDIDVTDAELSGIIRDLARDHFGPAPCRVGRPPKCLLMYRIGFRGKLIKKKALSFTYRNEAQKVELLGDGQQYVVDGVHPKTGRPYCWDRHPTTTGPAHLMAITEDRVSDFFNIVESVIEFAGCGCLNKSKRAGARQQATIDQETLIAPNREEFEKAVSIIPNGYDIDREQYIKMLAAMKAASIWFSDEAWWAVLDWAQRWETGINEYETVERDWNSLTGPFAVGWPMLRSIAERNGYQISPSVYTESFKSVVAIPSLTTVQVAHGDAHTQIMGRQTVKYALAALRNSANSIKNVAEISRAAILGSEVSRINKLFGNVVGIARIANTFAKCAIEAGLRRDEVAAILTNSLQSGEM